jgi:cell division septation protein DedD
MIARSPWVRRVVAAATTALAWAAGDAHVAQAASPYLEVPSREEVESAPAYRYANMTNEEAFAELERRGVPHVRLEAVPGVRAPIRFTGPLQGIEIHSSLPPEERAASPFEILDARLALALDDYAVVLARHDVVELVHYTMYRPNVPPPGSPSARNATRPKPSSTSSSSIPSSSAKPGTPKSHAASPTAARPPTTKPAPAKPSVEPTTTPAAKEQAPRTAKAKAKRRAELAPKATRDDKATRGRATSRERTGTKGKELETHVVDLACGHDHTGEAAFDTRIDTLAEEGAATGAKTPSPTRSSKPTATTPSPAARGPKKPAKRRVMLVSNERPHGTWAPPGTRHPAGLAIDLGSVRKSDGTVLSVSQHFRGKIGDKTCGADVADPETPEARELRALVCEARDAGIFTYALTPNFDAPHVDHFHLEIKPGVAWFLYH